MMVEETMPITGGCLCGAVRYEANEPPSKGVVCHCRVCQRTTGSAFEAIVKFPRTAFRFTKGEPKRYRSSSIMEKCFCPNCGSTLTDRYLVRKSARSEFAPVRSTGAPRMPNSKSAYDRLFLTRFGCRERRSQLRVFIATRTGEAIIEVNPG